MRVLVVHNDYAAFSGEEAYLEMLESLLLEHGHEVLRFRRSSGEIEEMKFGRLLAFCSGVYSVDARRRIRLMLGETHPHLVHAQNVYPLLSPSVLAEVCVRRIPLVMHTPNYRLTCPHGLHERAGQLCEECIPGREHRCIINRCEGSLAKSAGYALRNFVARKAGLFRKNVTMYVALTEFQRRRFVAAGFDAERIAVVPNAAILDAASDGEDGCGEYIAFAGRVSPEKGIRTLLAAAELCPDLPFRVAGATARMPGIVETAPANVRFLGHLSGKELASFYRCARIFLLPSTWFEGFPFVLLEAMLHSAPVIASRVGGLPEIVEDGRTGLLFESGNAADLAAKVRYLWERPELGREMGKAGREKALREYSRERHYERLMAVYEKAIALGPGGPRRGR